MANYVVLCNYREKYWYCISPLYDEKGTRIAVSCQGKKEFLSDYDIFQSKNKAKAFIKYARKAIWVGSYRHQNIGSYKHFKIIPVLKKYDYWYHFDLNILKNYHIISDLELKELKEKYDKRDKMFKDFYLELQEKRRKENEK